MSTIVVVDSCEGMREMLSDLLGAQGHRVVGFADSAPALAMVDFLDVDLIVIDPYLPTDGRLAIRSLRTRGITVPVIVYGGPFWDWEREALFDLGAQAVIHKPTPYREFLNVLDKFLEKKSLSDH